MTGTATMSLLFEATAKVSVVLLLALAVIWCLRHRSAAARHWVLSVAVACALVVPVLSAVAPTWYAPLTDGWIPSSSVKLWPRRCAKGNGTDGARGYRSIRRAVSPPC